MADTFLVNDLFVPSSKIVIKSIVRPLNCYICKKELNGLSITAKVINGKTVFLCSTHVTSGLQNIVSVS